MRTKGYFADYILLNIFPKPAVSLLLLAAAAMVRHRRQVELDTFLSCLLCQLNM
jgi:hypothetical protein